jgi:molybdopterin molybdotransferase
MPESPTLLLGAQLPPRRPRDAAVACAAPSLGAAKAAVLAKILPKAAQNVALDDAGGRILTQDVHAASDYWPFSRAAMDGVAVRAHDVADASPDAPTRLPVLGAAYCGAAPQELTCGQAAIRIATGAAIPPGCDAVIPQELLVYDDGDILVQRPVRAGKHIFPAGEDMHAGERVLRAGTRLQGGEIGMLAALGYAAVPVHVRPRVAILACGDELREPGALLTPGRVFDSNSYALNAELRALGCESRRIGIADDDPLRLLVLLKAALEGTDAVVTCGGLSVGERDYIRPALRELGATFVFEGVPMKPGHPFAFALYEDRPVFALPGTPGACRVAFEFFVRPALRAMQGEAQASETAVRLSSTVHSRPGRTRMLWARLHHCSDGLVAEPLDDQSSATLRSAADAHALLRIEPHESDLLAGIEVPALILTPERVPGTRRCLAAVLGVVGARNAGKTTLIEQMIPVFAARGIRIAVVKHHGHLTELDEPGKDSARAAAAGAVTTILAGPAGTVARTPACGPPSLEEILRSLSGVDLVLVEGFSDAALPKLRVERHGCHADDRHAAIGPFLALVGSGKSEDAPRFAADAIGPLVDYLAVRLFGSRFSAQKGHVKT